MHSIADRELVLVLRAVRRMERGVVRSRVFRLIHVLVLGLVRAGAWSPDCLGLLGPLVSKAETASTLEIVGVGSHLS